MVYTGYMPSCLSLATVMLDVVLIRQVVQTLGFYLIFQFIVVYVCVRMCTYVYVSVRLSMLFAPRQDTKTDIQKVEQVQHLQLVVSLVTIGELQVPLPCALTSCGIHCIPDVASDMPLCFVKFTMDNFASVCLSSLSLQMLALNATTSINSEHYQPPASSSTHVRSIPTWHSPSQEVVTAPTAEAFQKAALDVIK